MIEKTKWGILGCSRIARSALIPALQESDQTELVGIASRNPQIAQDWSNEFELPRSYEGYGHLLSDPDLDVVYIGLPNHLHCEWTQAAARSGKHVLCGKPLACNLDEAETMAACCNQNNVLLMEGFMWRHHPRTQRLLDWIDQGKIGALRMIRYSFALEMPPDDWRWKAASGGGALWDVGCYGVNTARLLCGSEPQQVQALTYKGQRGVDVTTVTALRFPDDVLVQIDCSFAPPFRYRVEIIGSRATLLVTRDSLSGPPPRLFHCLGDQVEPIEFGDGNQFRLMVEHFSEAIRTGSGLTAPAENGVANMRVLDRIIAACAVQTG